MRPAGFEPATRGLEVRRVDLDASERNADCQLMKCTRVAGIPAPEHHGKGTEGMSAP
jgi:hypothetical protein